MRFAAKLLFLVGILVQPSVFPGGVLAADLRGTAIASLEAPAPVSLREALSRFLSLEMIRATFDVVRREDLEPALEEQSARWKSRPPTLSELADLNQQLLTEASYYLVSLSYVVQSGGAVFPSDRSEMIYANDTVSKLEDLRRQLVDAFETGGDVVPVLTEAERIRALTEGYRNVPKNLGIFDEHGALLDKALAEGPKGTPT
ncbi:MAG: hypothetical protein JWQ89_4110 [Devosia sp.]|uniref:hypothetical protein n=1 Tax=Devosia sp. TaxID=1871048 RepID=UPI00261AB24D|nr:hypothetical protein [Devosia sp.]MDB5542383.1 hypothetical protein [Devosia sp.]